MAQGPLINPWPQNFAFSDFFPISGASPLHHAPAAATAAVVTMDLDASRGYVLRRITASYTTTPTGGSLQIESPSATIIWGPHALPTAGTVQLDLALITPSNQACIITLASGGGAVVGTLDVEAYRLQ